MEEYQGNSHKMKEESKEITPKKKVEKVTTGNVKIKKQSGVKKFADAFFEEDVDNVTTYIIRDVLVPAAKKAISDIVTNGIDMILYGESGHKSSSSSSKVSYRSYYEDKRNGRRETSSSRRSDYSYDDVIFDRRGEAEDVLERLEEIVNSYDMASVADLYDLVGITGKYTDNKYGWYDLHEARVVNTRDGYRIKLPKARPLN